MPNSDNDRRGPGDVERARVIARHCLTAEFGVVDYKVAELPGNCSVWRTDDAIFVKAVPATYCELE